MEASSRCSGSKRPMTGLNLLIDAWNTEGYGFVEFKMSKAVPLQQYSP